MLKILSLFPVALFVSCNLRYSRCYHLSIYYYSRISLLQFNSTRLHSFRNSILRLNLWFAMSNPSNMGTSTLGKQKEKGCLEVGEPAKHYSKVLKVSMLNSVCLNVCCKKIGKIMKSPILKCIDAISNSNFILKVAWNFCLARKTSRSN